MGQEKNTQPLSYQDRLYWQGFERPPFFKLCPEIDKVVDVTQDPEIKSYLDNQDIEFDWLVIKISNLQIRDLLWSTNHHPRRAIAYKYPAKQVTTQILSVDMQVGRTGIITPVANLQPVNIDGVTVSRVSLHNFDFIKEKDIHLDDHVVIQRSGEVIPYVVATLPSLRSGTESPIIPPTGCPICGSHIIKVEDNTVMYYCANSGCPASTIEKIKHFVSRDCMDIWWLGESIITSLLDAKIISDYTDLYNIDQPSYQLVIKNLPNMWQKKLDNIIAQLNKSKNNELYRIINAIWIPQVGIKTAKIIVDHIYQDMVSNDIDISRFGMIDLINYLHDKEFLDKIHSIWWQTVQAVKERLEDEHNIWLLNKLSSKWVRFNNFGNREKNLQSQKLEYLRFAISGKFEIPRDAIIQRLVSQGAQYMPNITKNTNLLIVWEDPSSKVAKASKLDIKTINGLEELSHDIWIDLLTPPQRKIESGWLFSI